MQGARAPALREKTRPHERGRGKKRMHFLPLDHSFFSLYEYRLLSCARSLFLSLPTFSLPPRSPLPSPPFYLETKLEGKTIDTLTKAAASKGPTTLHSNAHRIAWQHVHTALTALCHTMLYITIPWHTMPCHTATCRYHTIPYHAVPYCCCTGVVQYRTVSCHAPYAIPYRTAQYHTVPYCTVQAVP